MSTSVRRLAGLAAVLLGAAPLAVPPLFGGAAAAAMACPRLVESAYEAATLARRCGGQVEVASLTTESARVLVNPDGTRTAILHAGIERVHQDGRWQTVDLTLQRQADGSVRPRVHPHELVLAGRGNGGSDPRLASIMVRGQRVGLDWLGALPEPSLAENTATYPEVVPGVDLVVEATVSGFEQFLVVKERAAAARVSGLRQLALRTGTHRARSEPDGSVSVRDPSGQLVATMPAPAMWDATVSAQTGEHTRARRLTGRLTDTRRAGARVFELAPDRAFLTDPATRFPVTLDPGIAYFIPSAYDAFVQNNIVQDQNSATELKLGYSNEDGVFKARSYLRFHGLKQFAGAKIHSAHLRLWNFHSWSCDTRGWRAARTDLFSGATWAHQPAWRENDAATWETAGHPNCGDAWVKTEVDNILDDPFASGADSVALVLKAEKDNDRTNFTLTDHFTWKKFNSSNAASNRPSIDLTYNHVPAPSLFTMDGQGRCGTGEADRVVLANHRPQFEADLRDADSGQPETLEVRVTGSSVQVASGQVGSTGRHSVTWPTDLIPGVYTVDHRAGDGADWSDWSATCQLEISTDPPDVEPVDAATPDYDDRGTGVVIRLKPSPGDESEVAGYRFGDNQDRLGAIAPAGPDGTATLHVTNAAASGRTLYAQAINRAGTPNPDDPEGRLVAYQLDLPAFTPQTSTPGDVTGDGRADVVTLADVGGGASIVQLITGGAGGAASGVLYPLGYTRFPTATTTALTGDVDADGLTDIVLVTDGGAGQVAVQVFRSTGFTWESTTVPRDEPVALVDARPLVADFTGDGAADLGLAVRIDASRWKVTVQASTKQPGAVAFASSSTWLTTESDWSRARFVAGRFVGGTGSADERADLAYLYDHGGCHTTLWVHESTGDALHAGVQKWDGPSTCWAGSALAVADHTGDGRDDLLHSYDRGGCGTDLRSWVPDAAGTMHSNLLWASSQPLCASLSGLQPGDFDVDGKVDLAVTYRCCGPYQSRLWQFRSTGAGLAGPALMWEGGSGPPGVGAAPRNLAADASFTASSSAEDWGWSLATVNDGVREGLGWSSWSSLEVPHTEWLEMAFPGGGPRSVNRLDLYPRTDPGHAGENFPATFTIDVWTGSAWQTVISRTGQPNPDTMPQRFIFPEPETTSRIRIRGTSLSLMQLAEVEAYRSDNLLADAAVAASSAAEDWGWSRRYVNDARRDGLGWSSLSSVQVDHTEWLEFTLAATRTANRIDLYPRTDAGNMGGYFPTTFTVEAFTGSTWVTVVSRTGYPTTGGARQSFSFPATPVSKLRFTGTSLRYMQFAEVELYHHSQ